MSGPPDNKNRSYWLKTLHQWHWISSALCLLGMLMFAITGITLNNAGSIESQPKVVTHDGQLPPELRGALAARAASGSGKESAALPPELQGWLKKELALDVAGREAEWSKEEIYLSLPRPGGDAWVRIDRASGDVEYELTDRGWVSYLNDLHKGRNTGLVWSWFLDVFSAAALIFSVTGLFILKMHAGNRPNTWPMVGMGIVIPLVLAMLFIH